MSLPKILLCLDTDPQPSVFDAVVAVDAGVDQLLRHGGVTPDAVRDLVYGAMFTRGPADLKNTAVFIGGTDVAAGEKLLAKARRVLLRADARLGDARLERREHHGGRGRALRAKARAARGPDGDRAGGDRLGRPARRAAAGPRRGERARRVAAVATGTAGVRRRPQSDSRRASSKPGTRATRHRCARRSTAPPS